MAEKDYYSILGLSESDKKLHGKDFNDKLSKNFRKLSLKWHPDKWVNGSEQEKKNAEEKFKEISEAYSILSDEEKRNQYDMGGADPFAGFKRGGGFNPFGGGFNPFGFGMHQQGPVSIQGTDIHITVDITLEEAYRGTTKRVKIERDIPCSHCHGTGSKDGKTQQCPHCNGTGWVSVTKISGNMQSTISHPCQHCGGTGKIAAAPCPECKGSGVKKVSEEVEINVPKGVDNGTAIAYTGMGNAGTNGGPNGNLVATFRIKAHSTYARQGIDLIYTENVKFSEAFLGFKKEITCIDGTKVTLEVPELTKDGTKFTYRGKGMPIMDRFGRNIGNGDMLVVVNHILPTKLNKRQKEALKTFFD